MTTIDFTGGFGGDDNTWEQKNPIEIFMLKAAALNSDVIQALMRCKL